MQKIIKTLVLTICLLSSMSLFSKEQKFAIQTDAISQLIIDDHVKQESYSVPVFRQSSGGYLVACEDASKTFLHTSGEKISMKVLWINSGKSSQWIEINPNEKISLQDCILKYGENNLQSKTMEILAKITDFFSEAISGIAGKGEDAVLHNPRELIVFDQNEIMEIAHLNYLEISWTSQQPIESLSLLDIHDEKIWNSDSTYSHNQFTIENLPEKAVDSLHRGSNYFLELKLEDGSTTRRKFYYYTETEWDTLLSFTEG